MNIPRCLYVLCRGACVCEREWVTSWKSETELKGVLLGEECLYDCLVCWNLSSSAEQRLELSLPNTYRSMKRSRVGSSQSKRGLWSENLYLRIYRLQGKLTLYWGCNNINISWPENTLVNKLTVQYLLQYCRAIKISQPHDIVNNSHTVLSVVMSMRKI